MTNQVSGRISTRALQYVDISDNEAKKFRLRSGDILFNRTNSFELVGRTSLFDIDGDYVFASYLIRLRTIAKELDPRYLDSLFKFRGDSVASGLRRRRRGGLPRPCVRSRAVACRMRSASASSSPRMRSSFGEPRAAISRAVAPAPSSPSRYRARRLSVGTGRSVEDTNRRLPAGAIYQSNCRHDLIAIGRFFIVHDGLFSRAMARGVISRAKPGDFHQGLFGFPLGLPDSPGCQRRRFFKLVSGDRVRGASRALGGLPAASGLWFFFHACFPTVELCSVALLSVASEKRKGAK